MKPVRLGDVRRRLSESGVLDRAARSGLLRPVAALGGLDLIAQLHGTDKSARYHGFTRWYRRHLGPLRREPLTLLEIGVGGDDDASRGGSSLRMWRDYLPAASIYGVDVHRKDLHGLGPRVQLLQADQSRPEDMRRVLACTGRPDVVIDDGSHVGEHVWCTFRVLFPALAEGGWYVIEDLHTSFLDGYGSRDQWPIGVVLDAAIASQDSDPVVTRLEARTGAEATDVAEVHVYPGIAFVQKRRTRAASEELDITQSQ